MKWSGGGSTRAVISDCLGPVILQTPFQILGMPIFGALVLGALLYRRRPDVHKRLMWLTIPAGLIGAPVVHIIGHFGLSPVVAPLAVSDVPCGQPGARPHGSRPPSPGFSLGQFRILRFRHNVLAGVVAPHPQWQAFVLWLAS